MANVIKPKRSNTAAKVPNTSELLSGELGVNMADKKVYINNGTSIIQVGAGVLSALGDVSISSPTNGQSLSWNGTAWVNSTGSGSGTVTSVTGTAPVSVATGTTTPVISMAAATASVNGYMTSTYASKLDGIAAGATNVTNTNQLTNGAGFITSSGTSAACSGNAATATTATNLSGGTINGINIQQGNVAQNVKITSAGGTDSGISLFNSSGTWLMQLYGAGSQYGFLSSNWGGWDLQKTIGGALVLNGSQTVITSASIGSQSVNYANTAGRAYPYRVGGVDLNFNWSGQSGQPPWLWGGSDGSNMYVYNPSNFSVNAATYAYNCNSWFNFNANYGHAYEGIYNASLFQGMFDMGPAYRLTAGGGVGNLYGTCWSHPNAGGAAANLDSHGQIVLINGGFGSCMSYSIKASANVTAYSDERLKTNWKPLADNFVDKLSNIKVGTYDRIDQSITQVGVSAQSLETLLPEAVITGNDDMQTKSVAYGNAALASAVMLAKEIVEMKLMIQELKDEIANLKGNK
jgi:hypothetical protein